MSELRGEKVVLRPLQRADAEPLRAMRATPEVAARWGPLEGDFPFDHDPGTKRLTVVVDGRPAGMVQFEEEDDPDARSADIDIFLDPRHHNRGLGTDALRTLARHLLERRGHHRLTIVPAADNAPAIRSYEKAGFRPVGVTQASVRDPRSGEWVDELFMELVVPPPPRGRPR